VLIARARWLQLTALAAAWKDSSHPCIAPGPKVTERAQLHDDLVKATADAADAELARAAMSLRESELQGVLDLLAERYVTGLPASDDLKEAASAAARARDAALFTQFEAHKAWAKTGEAQTDVTCIFGKQAFDPTKPPEPTFSSHIEGRSDLHALCLIPLTADKWAGDPDGQVLMELHANGKHTTAMELGPPERWTNTRYFRGRFQMPQGVGSAHTAAYTVRITFKRPKLGDETVSSGTFLWNR
jgi:hypothetical protein